MSEENYQLIMFDDYEFLNCTCSEEQQEWQKRTVKALIPLGESLRESVTRFNQQGNHAFSLDEELSIALTYEWLKYFDSFMLLIKYGKFDVSLNILRTLLELSLQLAYLLVDDKELKAAYYNVSFYTKGHSYNVKSFQDRKNEFSTEILQKNDETLSRVKNSNDVNVQKVHAKLFSGDMYLEKVPNKEWYKLYYNYEVDNKGSYSIKQMLDDVAKELDPTRELLKKDTLYGLLSMHAHGLVAPMGVNIIDGVQIFRSFEDTYYAGWILGVILQLAQLNFLSLRKGYPNFKWISDEDLFNLRASIDSCSIEWLEKFREKG